MSVPAAEAAPSTTSAEPVLDPFGCWMQANYPHVSGHNPGAINAGVVTTCAAPPVWILQEAQIWEKRIWGWDKIGTPGYGEVHGKSYVETYAQANCRSGMTIKLNGNGRLMGDDGHIYKVHNESKIITIKSCASGELKVH